MLKNLLTVAAFAVAAAGPALASDLPSNKAPPAPIFTAAPPVFSWTGVYVGIEGGLDWSRAHGPLDAYGVAGNAPYHVASHNGLLGGMIGYNKQIGSLVLGIEGSGDGIIGGKQSTTSADALGNGYGITSQSTYDADIRGRVGVAIDRTLLYAAGGVAFGNVNTAYSGVALPGVASFNSDRVGWTVGAGLEYAFTDHIIGRAEYRFTDLGSASFNNAAVGVADKVHYDSNTAMMGVSYKFGTP
jgi:outer membrane immunogenic protein